MTSKLPPRSSRQRYRRFVQDYELRRLDQALEAEKNQTPIVAAEPGDVAKAEPASIDRAKRREYVRDYAPTRTL